MAKAAAYLLVTIAVLAFVTATVSLIARPFVLRAYSERFAFLPGQLFAEKARDVQEDAQRTCIIIGDSKAREGFDPLILTQVAGGRFVNAGTTGGNNEVLELQTAVLRRYDIRPRCIIVGVGMWMMFRNGSPDLIGEEYIGLLSWEDIANLASRPLFSSAGPRLVYALVMPLKAQSRQLNRMLRVGLHRLRSYLFSPLSIQKFELFKDELHPDGEYRYDGLPSLLPAQREAVVNRNKPYFDPANYGGKQQAISLRHTLDEMLRLTSSVIFVNMPETAIMDPAISLGEREMRGILSRYPQVMFVDCSTMKDEKFFYDEGHLNRDGRRILSEEVGRILGRGLSHDGDAKVGACVVSTP